MRSREPKLDLQQLPDRAQIMSDFCVKIRSRVRFFEQPLPPALHPSIGRFSPFLKRFPHKFKWKPHLISHDMCYGLCAKVYYYFVNIYIVVFIVNKDRRIDTLAY